MKKSFLISLIVILTITTPFASALEPKKNVINKTLDGTEIKCTGKRVHGALKDYDEVTDYYTFRDDNIYSKNLTNLYGNPNAKPKKVKELDTWHDNIMFTDKYKNFKTSNYKWVDIDKRTGEYKFKAKQFNRWTWYTPEAEVEGFCEIVK